MCGSHQGRQECWGPVPGEPSAAVTVPTCQLGYISDVFYMPRNLPEVPRWFAAHSLKEAICSLTHLWRLSSLPCLTSSFFHWDLLVPPPK